MSSSAAEKVSITNELLENFCTITGCTQDRAKFYLEAANGSLDVSKVILVSILFLIILFFIFSQNAISWRSKVFMKTVAMTLTQK